MKNEKAKKPTKKEVIKMLEARGGEQTSVNSLQRANIDTMLWVLSKLR